MAVPLNDLVSHIFLRNGWLIHYVVILPTLSYFQVISRICAYLPVSDLKSLRLLNSTWGRGADSFWRQRACLQLLLSADQDGLLKLRQFFNEVTNFEDYHHLGIHISSGRPTELDSFIPLFTHVCRQLIQTTLKSLYFGTDPLFDPESNMSRLFDDTLRHFAPSLESLKLALNFGDGKQKLSATLTELCDRDHFNFPKLKLLEDSSLTEYNAIHAPGYKGMAFYANLFHAEALSSLEIFRLSDSSNYLFRRARQEPILLSKLATLTTLEIGEVVWKEDLNLIKKGTWPLKTLSLRIGDNDEDGREALTQLLQSAGASLEHLTLEGVVGAVAFPICPKLETLSVFFDLFQSDRFWTRFPGFEPEPELTQPRLEFVENAYFPALRDLTLKIFEGCERLANFKRNPEWTDYLRQLFPDRSGDFFRTLQTLRVPKDWEIVEQEIALQLPTFVQIVYIPENECFLPNQKSSALLFSDSLN